MRNMDADGVVSDSSEEQEGDVENSPLGSDNVQSQGSAVGEQDIDRSYSPYVPHNALEAGTPTTTYTEIPQDATTGAVRSTRSPPPAYPGAQASAGNGPHPPAYGQLPPLRGSIKPTDAAMELEAMNAEVTENQPEPPPYNEAMSRLDAGISRQVETTFGPEVITGLVRDEPPPNYTDIDGRPPSEQTDPQSSDSDADIESRHSRAEVEAETAEPNGFPARIWARLASTFSLSTKAKNVIVITCIIVSLLVLFAILFPFQFSYVQYYQFALVRTKSTGRVSTDRVYEHGCYVLGADKEFVYLNRTMHMEEFNNLGMFTRDNVDLSVDAQVYYLLKYESIGQLWRDYAGKHESVIQSVSKTTIRNCAYRVSQDEYLNDREAVQDLIHNALIDKLAEFGLEVPIFNYLRLYLPERVLEKKLKLLLIRTDIEKELAYQQQREVELGTELITTPILYSGKFVNSHCGLAHYSKR